MLKIREIVEQLSRLVFSITLVGYKKCGPDWYQLPRQQSFYSLWFVSKGTGEFVINGTAYPVEPGKLFFFDPSMICERKSNKENPLEYYFIRFSFAEAYLNKEQWVLNNKGTHPFPLSGMYHIQNPPQVINILEQILHLWKRRGLIVEMKRTLMLWELLLQIIEDMRSQKVIGNTTNAIEETIDYLTSHYYEHITLEGLAQRAGMSVSHYSRLFKKYLGYSPMDFLKHLRVDRAKELMVLSDYRLKAIAQSVGYQDELYFSRVFKKIEGVSPSEFVKRNKTKITLPPNKK